MNEDKNSVTLAAHALPPAMELEMGRLQETLQANPAPGETPMYRIWFFFTTATLTLVSKPNLARATLRATASGEPASAEKVLRSQFSNLRFQDIEDVDEDGGRVVVDSGQIPWGDYTTGLVIERKFKRENGRPTFHDFARQSCCV